LATDTKPDETGNKEAFKSMSDDIREAKEKLKQK